MKLLQETTKQTRNTPRGNPNKVPPRNERNIEPGMLNVCKLLMRCNHELRYVQDIVKREGEQYGPPVFILVVLNDRSQILDSRDGSRKLDFLSLFGGKGWKIVGDENHRNQGNEEARPEKKERRHFGIREILGGRGAQRRRDIYR